jgi:hypothetical protein
MLGVPLDLNGLLGLGREATALTFLQISLRGVIVFIVTLVIVRCGDRRFLWQKTAFDAVLGFILASMLARAVNGTAAFFPTLGGGFVLVILHRVLAPREHLFHERDDLDGSLPSRTDAFIAGNPNGRRIPTDPDEPPWIRSSLCIMPRRRSTRARREDS